MSGENSPIGRSISLDIVVPQGDEEEADKNRPIPDQDFKIIGVFATEQQAQAAIEQLKSQSGFKEYPNGFHIDAYPLNQIHWSQGFGC